MRALTVNEWSLVAGGDGGEEPMEEVVVTGKRCKEKWSCLSQEELEAFLENTYTHPMSGSGSGGGGAQPSEISTESLDKMIRDALASTDDLAAQEKLLVAIAAVAIAGIATFYASKIIAAGMAMSIVKYGIVGTAAILAAGGTYIFDEAMDEIRKGR